MFLFVLRSALGVIYVNWEQMAHKKYKKRVREPAEKSISLKPLKVEDALEALLKTEPPERKKKPSTVQSVKGRT